MAGLWIPRGFQKSTLPGWRVNTQHPFARDLHRVWTWNDLPLRDYVVGDVLTNERNEADTRLITTDRGVVYEAGASSPKKTISGASVAALGGASVSVLCRYQHWTTNGFLGPYTVILSGAAAGWSPRLLVTDGTAVEFAASITGATHGSSIAVSFTSGQWYTVGGTFERDGSGSVYGGTWRAFSNGVLGTANNVSISAGFGSNTFASSIWYTQQNDELSGASNHLLYDYLAVWSRALSADEIAAVSAEPYALLTR